MTVRPTVADKRRAFKALHHSGCFVLPNPWDVGSARYLQSLGFQALASTSSGLAWSLGRPDNDLPRETVLQHLSDLVEATDLPINADFESGFGADPAAVGDSVRLAVATGIAGLSIEDSTGDPAAPFRPIADAAARIRAARAAIDAAGGDTMLVGRAECSADDADGLAQIVARLQAYSEAGADCLYAPGVHTETQIRTVVDAVHPKPVNLLVSRAGGLALSDIARLGARRVSVGGALARAAWDPLIRASRALAEGSFEGFTALPSHDQIDALFRR